MPLTTYQLVHPDTFDAVLVFVNQNDVIEPGFPYATAAGDRDAAPGSAIRIDNDVVRRIGAVPRVRLDPELTLRTRHERLESPDRAQPALSPANG